VRCSEIAGLLSDKKAVISDFRNVSTQKC